VFSTASDARLNDASGGTASRARGAASRIWTPRWLPPARWARWGYHTLLGVVALFGLHVIAINVFLLSGSLDRLLLQKTGGIVKLDTATSFSLWPGLVHLRGLRLEVIDSNVHLEIVVPRGRTKVRLSRLLAKQFTTSSIAGEHLSVRVRPKFRALSPRRRQALPPLEDAKESGAPSEPERLWGIELAGIDAHFDELWISELRYRGHARIDGGFELRPTEALEIHPSRVQLEPGQLTYGPDEPILSPTRARFEARLPETPVAELPVRWRERISFALDVAAKVESVRFVEALAPPLAGLSGGEGELTALARAEGGRWVDELALSYATSSIRYAREAKQARASVRIGVRARSNDQKIEVDAGIDSFVLTRGAERLASLDAATVRGALGRGFPFPEPEDVSLSLREMMLAGLAPLGAFDMLPAAMRAHGGKIVARAELRWHDDRVTGSARAELRAVEFTHGDWTFTQSGQLDLIGLSWRVSHRGGRVERAALRLDDVQLRHPDAKIDDWHFALDCGDLRFSSARTELHAGFIARSDDAKPALVLMGVRGLPPGVDRFLAMPNLRVLGELDLSPKTQDVTIQRAESDTIDVRGRFVRQDGENHAAVLFKARPLSLGVRVDRKDSGFQLLATDSWLASELTRLPPGGEAKVLTGQRPRRSASAEATSLTAGAGRQRVPE
jgi:hypothetical protein